MGKLNEPNVRSLEAARVMQKQSPIENKNKLFQKDILEYSSNLDEQNFVLSIYI